MHANFDIVDVWSRRLELKRVVIGRISQGLAQSHVYSLAGIEKSGHGTYESGLGKESRYKFGIESRYNFSTPTRANHFLGFRCG
jgi:hypothetical protein